MELKEVEKKKRNVKRSPNFPIIDLETAIENIQKIYKADGRAGSRISALFKHLGYKGSHGVSRSTISAMKKFGLLREEGDIYHLTQDALVIVMATDENKKKAVIRECALRPEIYKTLWQQYSNTGLPSEHTLRDQLIFEMEFNEKSVDSFIQNFKRTLSFAGIEAGEEIPETEKKERGEEMIARTKQPDLILTTSTGDKVIIDVKVQDYLIPRKGDKIALLRLEKPVHNEDIDLIVKWLELLRSTIVDSSQEDINN